MQKVVIAVLMSYLVAPTGASAQDSIAANYEKGLGDRASTRVAAPTTIRDAALREVTLLAATLAPAQIEPPPHQRSWAGRHPVLLGTLIGAGTAVSLDVATCGGCGFVWPGAGAGAWGGLIASAIGTSHSRYERPSGTTDVAAVARVVQRLGVGERIIITANLQETRGKIRTIGRDQVAVTPDGQSTPVEIAYADIQAVKGKVGAGTKIGIAGGAGALGIILGLFAFFGADQ